VQDIYAAFGRGDVPAIMQHMSGDLPAFGTQMISAVLHLPVITALTVSRNLQRIFAIYRSRDR
jgi:hypothetical protein